MPAIVTVLCWGYVALYYGHPWIALGVGAATCWVAWATSDRVRWVLKDPPLDK